MVEHLLAKEDVASSSLVTRSSLRLTLRRQGLTMRSVIAVHFENLLFLLLIAAALLFQLLTRAASKASRNQREQTSTPSMPEMPPPNRRASTKSDEERIRKFLEALGQPATTRPPPPVAQRTHIPPRPLAPVRPPIAPLWNLTREERRKRDLIQRESPPPGIAKRAEIIDTPPFEVHEGLLPVEQPPIIKTPTAAYAPPMSPVAKGADFKTDIATLLASKSGLRDAIILREIFGPPRSLQPLDLVANT